LLPVINGQFHASNEQFRAINGPEAFGLKVVLWRTLKVVKVVLNPNPPPFKEACRTPNICVDDSQQS
jgi:hypothetical protein